MYSTFDGHTNIHTLHNISCNNSDAKEFEESSTEKKNVIYGNPLGDCRKILAFFFRL